MKRLMGIALVVLLTVGVAGLVCAAGPEQAAAEKPSMEESSLVNITATVEAVDLANRTVTLKGPEGNIVTLKVGEEAVNLPQVKVGDKVKADYYQSVAVEVFKAGEAPAGAEAAGVVATAKPGEKPAGIAADTITVTTTIEAIDREAQTVTLKGPAGNTETVKVRKPENLEKVQVGDEVVITYTQALAIRVIEAE